MAMREELAAEINIIVNGDDFKVSCVCFKEMGSQRCGASFRNVVFYNNLCSNRRCSAVEL